MVQPMKISMERIAPQAPSASASGKSSLGHLANTLTPIPHVSRLSLMESSIPPILSTALVVHQPCSCSCAFPLSV